VTMRRHVINYKLNYFRLVEDVLLVVAFVNMMMKLSVP